MEHLSLKIKQKRGSRGIREVAKEIGISPATLSRIETGKQPDLTTFGLICKWLEVDPSSILGIKKAAHASASSEVQAHFRAHKTMKPETAQHLANLILAVQRTTEKGV